MIRNKNANLGLGTAAIGRPQYINIRQESTNEFSLEEFRSKGMAILDTAYCKGIRYYDTAPGYGMAEQLLIDWLKGKDDENIEVATKWGYTYVADFNPNASQHEVKEHSLAKLNEQWAKSKDLLPFMKTYQIHSATFETGVLENKAVLYRLAELKNKYDLNIGITTTGANQSEVLRKALEINVEGEELFNLFQVTYNVFDQSLANIAEDISNQNKKLVIKEALANGRVFPNEKYPNYSEVYDYLNHLANKYEVGIDAIALRFCMDSIPCYQVLSGAANEQHLTGNLKTTDFYLAELEISKLKQLAVSPDSYWRERKQLGWN
ncbi:MAG: aldo/keto reductase [Saprospiraceae bacterium]